MKFKRILTLLTASVALFMTTISAQPGGGGMGGPGGGMGGPSGQGGPPSGSSSSIDPIAMTGYFEIDVDKAIKKCKVKSESEKSAIRKVFADFVIGSGDVYASHPEEFASLEEMKALIAEAQMGESSTDMRTQMRSMMAGTMKIKQEMTPLHKTLNSGVEEILADNEKSLNRWKIYYQDICESNNYSDRERRQRSGEGEEGGQQRGGMDGSQRGMGGPGGGMGGF